MNLVESGLEKNKAFQEVPVIDLQNLNSEDPAQRAYLAQVVKDACMRVGFFYVKNHEIPETVIDNTFAAAKDFFDLPLEKKMIIDHKRSSNFKGYIPLLSGNNNPDGAGDVQEGFEFGWEPMQGSSKARLEDGIMAGANIWPSENDVPGFRNAALQYYHAATTLGKSLFPLFALALGLPETFFDDKTQNSAALMKLLHYPPQSGPVDERTIGIGAHTDWECFTILWQEPGIQALQVLNAEHQWVNAPPIPGTLVINLGDQFARWTNGIFKSTVHRAINRSGVRRYSIPLFFGADYNVRLDPIPGCVSTERPLKYEIMTAGEHVKSRLQATYSGH
ncbi:hypothetical protein AGABI1DRAFT_58577 [Agaricus bisporus var. burnettii JB137-S8]|uniref:Fe2OG dioxygenase domain-containing protein n=1 Tax=Agaricus bisporus var. burnettii (strain JB137-S8 / ATCC MYA-4627 / FGSC 10392) TaxID=597362 RepID=K5X7K9_AGABU|nr:uncharacterized protein AGABI1DRAFT_58577 [Agaricus bisporus var. burnettii JB137-S8]EKM79178.1 hypothetical protein AGABI1DRAFT_58577 [Agaricus bisporus var. burnettii JB137-S8]